MAIKEGLKTTLNQIRELSTELYQKQVPAITDDMSISAWGAPILEYKEVQNEFISNLINRIVYTQFEIKYFRNPLKVLEGDRIPLGYAGQEIYVNPAQGRQFNGDDFAGLLAKYESDVKVQYMAINSDLQYPVTILRQDLKKAFVSWGDLETFIDQLSNSLYNGAYIDEFRFTKNLISGAYEGNRAVIEQVTAPTTEELAKQFVTQARTFFLNFGTPSSNYNAWSKMGGSGRPIVTWTEPEDVVFIIRNDLRAYLDVNVLANAFNMDKTTLMGNIISVDNFDVYDNEGNKIFDGSNIIGFMGDKSWFRIKEQDMFMDTFYNPNNRTWQYYLNIIKMYNYSLFANGVIFATELPEVTVTGLDYNSTESVDIIVGEKEGLDINVTPANANTPAISYEIANTSIATIVTHADNDRHVTITGVTAGTTTLTAKAGNVQTTINVTVTSPSTRKTQK